jgi:ribonuclease HI
MTKIVIFTDGSVPNNQSKNAVCGGIGVFFGDNDPRNISETFTSSEIKVTNNTMEFIAAIKGIKQVENTNSKILIVSDSEYLINSMTKWAKKWKENNWKKSNNKPIENQQLVIELYELTQKYNVKYLHQRSHLNPPKDKTTKEYKLWYGNFMADKLAFSASTNC